MAANRSDGIDLLVCQIEAFDDYLDCIDQLVPACDTGGVGVCNGALDSRLTDCNNAADLATSVALDACD